MYQPLLLGHEHFVAQIISLKNFPVHWHSEIEVAYCIKGKISVTIEEQTYTLTPGKVALITAATEHAFFAEEEPTLLLTIVFGHSFLGESFSQLLNAVFHHPIVDLNENAPDNAFCIDIRHVLNKLVEINENNTNCYTQKWELKSYLYQLAVIIFKDIPSAQSVNKIQEKRIRAIMSVQPAFTYIRNNYHQRIILEDVAAITGYEKTNFCKQFKWATQTSFHKYLNGYRMKIACSLLDSQVYNIYQVGEMVGIEEAKSFSRIFKQHLGMTPTEYIKMRKGVIQC